MKRLIFFITLFIALLIVPSTSIIHAQEQPTQHYSTGRVSEIIQQTQLQASTGTNYMQELKVVEDKTNATRDVTVGGEQQTLTKAQLYHVGQRVVLVSQADLVGNTTYAIADHYRIPAMLWLFGGFFILVIVVSGWKGITSLLGMGLSMFVLVSYMVPQIVAGVNPVLISIVAAGIISALIIYLGHGFNYRSHVALFCMLVTLALVGVLSHLVINWAHLNGTGDETASYLQFSGLPTVNLRGLLLGGIILAALSVLDDSTVSQVSVLHQLKKRNKDISFHELFESGMEVGRDHISTLVNTLILAYAGASLPLFILFTITTTQPTWVSLNDPMIAEEIVRTITGSIGLVLSIPLTTFIAAYVIHRKHK